MGAGIRTPHQGLSGIVRTSGHSILNGAGASAANRHSMLAKIAAEQGGLFENKAIGGALCGWNQGSPAFVPGQGGWAYAMQNIVPARTAAPYLPMGGISLVFYGLNDLAGMGPTLYQTPFKWGMRGIIARHRASRILEETDAAFTWQGPAGVGAGSWSTIAATERNSGAGYRQTTANDRFLFTIPADVPAGSTVTIYLIAEGDVSNALGATFTFSSSAGALTARMPTGNAQTTKGQSYYAATPYPATTPNARYTCVPIRITGCTGGEVLTCDLSAIGTRAMVDHAAIEATPIIPRVFLLAGLKGVDYTYYSGGGWPFTPTDASVDAMDADTRAVQGEFDQNVVVVDVSNILGKNAVYFNADKLHPNDLGHELLAAAVTSTINARIPNAAQDLIEGGWPPFQFRNLTTDLFTEYVMRCFGGVFATEGQSQQVYIGTLGLGPGISFGFPEQAYLYSSAANVLRAYFTALDSDNGYRMQGKTLRVPFYVKAASTVNIASLSAPGATIDGVTLSAGDEILLKNQTTTSQNGPWIWNGAAVAMTRPAWWTLNVAGFSSKIAVEQGTQAATEWLATTAGFYIPDTTGVTFVRDDSAWSEWGDVAQANGTWAISAGSGTYVMREDAGNLVLSSGTQVSGVALLDLDPAQYAAVGKTAQVRVIGQVAANNTAQTSTFTFGLYPVTSNNNGVLTLGAVVGQTSAIAAPGANALPAAVYGAAITMPAAGRYVLGVVTSAAIAASNPPWAKARLQHRIN